MGMEEGEVKYDTVASKKWSGRIQPGGPIFSKGAVA